MPKVLVAMSGGVDSSVAAVLLLKKGYEVIGGTMEVVPHYESSQVEDEYSIMEDAKMIAHKLGFPHYEFNFKDVFQKEVIENFVTEYSSGRTPNPCVICNKEIKFKLFLQKAEKLGADFIATGHYAKIIHDYQGRHLLRKSVDEGKDQTYMLYGLTQYQIEHTLMPLGNYNKGKVRKIAKELGFQSYNKPESQDICFIPDNNYIRFLQSNYLKKRKFGPILDTDGRKLGEHKGLYNYTVGQRKGLGISLGYPIYVIKLDRKKNAVIVGKEEYLYKQALIAESLNWISISKLKEPLIVKAKIRYNTKETGATIYPINEDEVKVVFDNKQRAISPGQSVVFYDNDDIVIGGGIISKAVD